MSASTVGIQVGEYGRFQGVEREEKSKETYVSFARYAADEGYRILQLIDKTSKVAIEIIKIRGKDFMALGIVFHNLAKGAGPAWVWMTVSRMPQSLVNLTALSWGKQRDCENSLRKACDSLSILAYGAHTLASCTPVFASYTAGLLTFATVAETGYNVLAARYHWGRANAFAQAGKEAAPPQQASASESEKNQKVKAEKQQSSSASAASTSGSDLNATGFNSEARLDYMKTAKCVASLASLAITCALPPLGFVAPKVVELTVSLASTVLAVSAGTYDESRAVGVVAV